MDSSISELPKMTVHPLKPYIGSHLLIIRIPRRVALSVRGPSSQAYSAYSLAIFVAVKTPRLTT